MFRILGGQGLEYWGDKVRIWGVKVKNMGGGQGLEYWGAKI